MVIGIDVSEISRMRHFAELADNFELFRAKHPDCLSWNRVKLLLVGKQAGEERTVVQAFIGRLKTATADLKKSEFKLDDVRPGRASSGVEEVRARVAIARPHHADRGVRPTNGRGIA